MSRIADPGPADPRPASRAAPWPGVFQGALAAALACAALCGPGPIGPSPAAAQVTLGAIEVQGGPDALPDFDFYAAGPYREGVPRPDEFLGYPPGTLHTRHDRMRAYLDALVGAAPGRIAVEPYGESYEKHELVLAFIGSESTLARREEIRAAVQRLADPRVTSPDEAAALAAGTPIIVWLDYGNDGNETANMEAAMQVAYQLVAGEGEDARRYREEALVILNPMHNPESHERHVAWYNAFGIGAEDPLAMEHRAPWGMSTNNNHFQIDINRDKWGITQVETIALVRAFLHWRPQVLVDHHGQTEQYFFPPPVDPVNPSLPGSHLRWLEAFGRGNARAFDEHGWQYYVRDVFDLHYPGYWDTWPSLHGAIGMTYETDAGGSKGLRWRRQDGTVVTFRDGIAKHFTASLATVRTAVENREAILRDFHDFFRTGMEDGRRGEPARAYALASGDDPRLAAVLASTLLRHGIEVRRATRAFTATGRHHQTGVRATRELPAGTYVVDMAQPDQRAAETFLALEAPLDSSFVRRQLAKWARNARRGPSADREGYEFYDITAWSLPVAFGVDAYALDAVPSGAAAEPVEPHAAALAGNGYWEDELAFDPGLPAGVGGAIGGPDAPAVEGAVERARSAYLWRPEPEGAMRLLAGLLREGYEVAVSARPLMAGGVDFPRGSFAVRVSRNPESVHERIDALARDAGVRVVATHTAFPARGQTGTGSNEVRGLEAPRVAMIADEGVRITEYGAAWFTLERRLGYPFTPIRIADLLRADLDAFDVVVVPGGSAAEYASAFGESGVEALGGWLGRGGTLVTWGGGVSFAMDNDWLDASFVDGEAADSAEVAERLAEIDALPREPGAVPPAISPGASPGSAQSVPGANLRAALDLTHWLTIGYTREEMPVLVSGSSFLSLSGTGDNPVVFPDTGELRVSGFVWPHNTERLVRGTAWAVVEPVGRGQVVAFHADPSYRLTWRATSRLFANALLLGPTLGTR